MEFLIIFLATIRCYPLTITAAWVFGSSWRHQRVTKASTTLQSGVFLVVQ